MSYTGFAAYNYLIVDDDPFMCDLISGLLRKTGAAHIAVAHNGQEAINILTGSKSPPDLIICDLNMPEFNGIELLRYLSDNAFEGGIILVTGTDKVIRDAASKLGRATALDMIATIPKPFTLEDLVLIISSYSKNHRILAG